MSFRILRSEQSKSREGDNEYFLQVEVIDASGVHTRAEWLTPAEVAQVINDYKAISTLAAAMAARATAARPAALVDEARGHEMQVERLKAESATATLQAAQAAAVAADKQLAVEQARLQVETLLAVERAKG
jgi:multidrug efflux pump subunit AcrA (membrane-fusion protein)